MLFKLSLIAALAALSICSDQKLPIGIFIESECRFSKKFIQEQVKPNYNDIKDNVSLTYVPFGKSKSFQNESGIYFICQHGSYECEGNMFQSCALKLIGNNMDRQTSFMFCAMDYNPEREQCASEAGLSMKDINECMESGDGAQLQLQAEILTAPIIAQSEHVPTIVFNGVFDETDDYKADVDFLRIIREKLNQ